MSKPWSQESPKSETESWAWDRRQQLLNLSAGIFVASIPRGDNEMWNSETREDFDERVKFAVEAAKQLTRLVDETVPRF